ncbi:hypothetical protein M408DRAFT_69369 [Serendipita vermifera MAFF 305830]|uniref:NmrA-like domain-containing protein n=1 Tax=Serendipita vermifera MAFF 305830 TaxID=933852 RepID=A0A0C2WR57_SERVB|nr:hypothetical protein M408DRAFT_69369 [Serendipita vermifera MAFF 305830]
MTKPIIVVFAATGKSGGGMVEALLKDGSFAVRAVTRNPDSGSGRALAAKGAEVVKADLDEPETLTAVMKGAYGVFGVTDFWTAFLAEEQQGKDMIDAAKSAGVKHFVWTTLDYSEWHVPHFETKARANDYLIESGLPRTSIYLSYFLENLRGLDIRRNHAGTLVFHTNLKTDGKIPMIAASDIGGWALAAFKDPDTWIGKDMKIAVEYMTPKDIAARAASVFGEPVHVQHVSEEAWNASRSPGFEEIWLNLQTFYTAGPDYRDVEMSNKLLPNAKRLEDFLQEWGGKALIRG